MPAKFIRDFSANEPAVDEALVLVAVMTIVAILFGGFANLLNLCVAPTEYRPIFFSLLIFFSIFVYSLITAYFKHRHLEGMERKRQKAQKQFEQQLTELLNCEEVKKVLGDTTIPQEIRDSYWEMRIAILLADLQSQGYYDIPQTQNVYVELVKGNQYKTGHVTNSPGTNTGNDNMSAANRIQQPPASSLNKEILRQIREQLEQTQPPEERKEILRLLEQLEWS